MEELGKCQIENYQRVNNINIEDQELLLKRLNEKILKTNNRIKRLPFSWLRDYAYKRYIKQLAYRNEVFRNLREATRTKYPERFIGYDYK